MSPGWMRVGLAVVLLVAVVAFSAWYKQRAPDHAESDPATSPSSSEKAHKPPWRGPGASRDALRERPERERTDRPGDGRSSPK
jgi:hypothetical protein